MLAFVGGTRHLLFLVALFGCRGREHLVVRGDPVVAADGGVDAGAEVDARPELSGNLVVPGAIALLAGADEASFRWGVERPSARYQQFEYFERGHEEAAAPRPLELFSNETLLYADPRWVLSYSYGWNHPDSIEVRDRLASTPHPLPLGCARVEVIARDRHAYLVGFCPPRSEVAVFDVSTGALRRWFVAGGLVYGSAVDADAFYYLLDDNALHARSRTTGADRVVLRGMTRPPFVVMGGAAFSCTADGLFTDPFDGSPRAVIASTCTGIVSDSEGIVFSRDDAIFALDPGASQPRELARGLRLESREGLAITRAWVYFLARDGIRRVLRR